MEFIVGYLGREPQKETDQLVGGEDDSLEGIWAEQLRKYISLQKEIRPH